MNNSNANLDSQKVLKMYYDLPFIKRNNIDKFSCFKDLGCATLAIATTAFMGVAVTSGAGIVPLAVISAGLIGAPIAVIAAEPLGMVKFVKSSISELRCKYSNPSVDNKFKI